jgi:hypothetical protein
MFAFGRSASTISIVGAALLLLAASALAGWEVRKDAGADTYGVYEDDQRRGTLLKDGGSFVVEDGTGKRRARAEKSTIAESFSIGGVRQDPGSSDFGVYDQAGHRLGTLRPEK